MGAPGDKRTKGETLSRVRLAVECGPSGDKHHNSGSVRERRLAVRGNPPGDSGETWALSAGLAPSERDYTARRST